MNVNVVKGETKIKFGKRELEVLEEAKTILQGFARVVDERQWAADVEESVETIGGVIRQENRHLPPKTPAA